MKFMQCLARWKGKMHRFNVNKLGDTPYQIYSEENDDWSEFKKIPQNPEYKQAIVENSTLMSAHRRDFSKINKILIIGFPHSGTTVLRAKMGDAKNAIELTNETDFVDSVMSTNLIDEKIIAKTTDISKSALIRGEFNDKGIVIPPENNRLYHDYHVVAIVKNPYEIFGSLSRRFGSQYVNMFDTKDEELKMRINQAGFGESHCETHSFSTFETFAKFWLKYRDGSEPRYNCIKYEEMFKDNFSCLKNLFSKIGLDYDDKIFEKRQNYYGLQSIPAGESKRIEEFYKKHDAQPPDNDNTVRRSWQIHQEFKAMTKPESYKDISSELLERIKNSDLVKKLGYEL